MLYEKKLFEQYTRELDHAFETLSAEAVEAANDHLAHEILTQRMHRDSNCLRRSQKPESCSLYG